MIIDGDFFAFCIGNKIGKNVGFVKTQRDKNIVFEHQPQWRRVKR